jgi:hypothetical protein
MARIVVGSPNLTQPLLLYPGLGPAMLEQHRRSFNSTWQCFKKFADVLPSGEASDVNIRVPPGAYN